MSCVWCYVLVGVRGEGIRGVLRLILGSSRQVTWRCCLSKAAEKALGLLSANSRSAGEGGMVGAVLVLQSSVEVATELTRVTGGACRFVVVSGVEPLLVVANTEVGGWGFLVRRSQMQVVVVVVGTLLVAQARLMVVGSPQRCLKLRKSLGCHGKGGQRCYRG